MTDGPAIFRRGQERFPRRRETADDATSQGRVSASKQHRKHDNKGSGSDHRGGIGGNNFVHTQGRHATVSFETHVALSHSPSPPLSLVVLPFVNLSHDAAQEYFALTYKGTASDARLIGRELDDCRVRSAWKSPALRRAAMPD
jgi:hypothetical protein